MTWKMMRIKLNLKINATDWCNIVNEIGSMKCNNSIRSIITMICLGSVVYNIWKEKNNRLFTYVKMDIDFLSNVIISGVKIHLMSLQVKDLAAGRRTAKEWDVKFKMNKNQTVKEYLAKADQVVFMQW
uniref:Reverse transcriptase zinc-binding domain-containing protein n=1 Tax=Tanacetum cinerariifolium TaxID=118510 RepID=A0A699L3Q7_TANCI|nr:reverse transcriptase zinc-binding domain-containing protein [Tanacetum cinerariifolium]